MRFEVFWDQEMEERTNSKTISIMIIFTLMNVLN